LECRRFIDQSTTLPIHPEGRWHWLGDFFGGVTGMVMIGIEVLAYPLLVKSERRSFLGGHT
jgi:hypothetical protein